MKSFFPPAFMGLRRVIPIAQAQRHGDITVTLVALEVYEHDGCIMSLLLETGPGTDRVPERFGRAFLHATMRLDGGAAHRSGRATSEGQSGADYLRQRALVPFYRVGLPPDIPAIEIEIPELRWEHYERLADAPDERYATIPGETTIGPWRFTVPVAPS